MIPSVFSDAALRLALASFSGSPPSLSQKDVCEVLTRALRAEVQGIAS